MLSLELNNKWIEMANSKLEDKAINEYGLLSENNIKIEKISIKCNINYGLDENNAALY